MDLLFKRVWEAITPSKICIDNYTSRLHYQLAFGICLAATALLGSDHLYSGPIECKSNDPDNANYYCLRKGTQRCNSTSCKIEHNCDYHSDLTLPDMKWYQHGILILFFNAIVFRIGRAIWKICEGGVMKEMYSDDAKKGNKEVMDEVLERKTPLYQQLNGNPKVYHAKFVFSQFLNTLVVIGIFSFDNFILGQGSEQFKFYGILALYWVINPIPGEANDAMCNIFPILQTQCDTTWGGSSGAANTFSGACTLHQNEYNQYIYLILWYLYSTLIIIGMFQLIFEVALIFLPKLRYFFIERQLGPAMRTDVDRARVRTLLNAGNYGDWFLLYQIGKNMHRDYFMEFLRRITSEADEEIQMLEFIPDA